MVSTGTAPTSLPTTGDDVSVKVDTITSGSISEVVIESGLPKTTVVGDILRYENANTKGAGAEAKVTHVDGVLVDNAFGQEVVTRLLSHRQRINLRFNAGEKYTFSVGYQFRTSSGAEAVVVKYDYVSMFLDVTVTTENLIKFGDTFFDQKNREIQFHHLKMVMTKLCLIRLPVRHLLTFHTQNLAMRSPSW